MKERAPWYARRETPRIRPERGKYKPLKIRFEGDESRKITQDEALWAINVLKNNLGKSRV